MTHQAHPPTVDQQLADARTEIDTLLAERRALCDVLSADSGTVAGQTLVEALRTIIYERDEAHDILRDARIYVDRMTIQVGPVAHDCLWQAKRVLQLIDAVLDQPPPPTCPRCGAPLKEQHHEHP